MVSLWLRLHDTRHQAQNIHPFQLRLQGWIGLGSAVQKSPNTYHIAAVPAQFLKKYKEK